jgi:hypothetical protein
MYLCLQTAEIWRQLSETRQEHLADLPFRATIRAPLLNLLLLLLALTGAHENDAVVADPMALLLELCLLLLASLCICRTLALFSSIEAARRRSHPTTGAAN